MHENLEGNHTEETLEAGAGKKVQSGLVRLIIDLLETLILAALLFVGINAISARIRVDGISMEPTLHNGEFVVVNKLAYRFGSPQIGDVIVFLFPRDPNQEYVKRVIGLPGDEVVVSGGQVKINGSSLVETYLRDRPAYEGSWTVPDGNLFVLGDNRNNSSDSHSWGTVPMDDVIGTAVFVYWPPPSWGVVEHVPPEFAAP